MVGRPLWLWLINLTDMRGPITLFLSDQGSPYLELSYIFTNLERYGANDKKLFRE